MNPVVVERKTKHSDGSIHDHHIYWCPGCDTLHRIAVVRVGQEKAGSGPCWTFDGDMSRPTYNPSQLSRYPREGGFDMVCHTFIRGGMIQFLDDCTHDLRGQTVRMVPVPDYVVASAQAELPL